jgi:thymidylate synthase (FAD)
MKIIKTFYIIETPIDGDYILKFIEKAGRTCYKSEDKINSDSAKRFVKNLVERGHLSVIEHFSVSVRMICDRGVSHEIVRHRPASYTQESTRYCNYAKGKFDGELTFIEPCFWSESDEKELEIWKSSMSQCEKDYIRLIEMGATPQEARSILPNSLKTEILVTMNLREWKHFLTLRTAKASHPQMREICIPILKEFKEKIPVIFDDIPEEM